MIRRKILIVEDELIIAKDIERILLNQNYKVIGISTDTADAIQKVKLFSPDLVLIDIILKGSDNGTSVGHFLSTNSNIPFIYITSMTDYATVQKATDTVPLGYIVKPFRDRDITTTIEVAFANYEKQIAENSESNKNSLSEIPIRLRKVAVHIQENIAEKLSNDELSKITGWNTYHFIRNFKKYLGDTPYQYVLKSRIKKAKELLIKSDFPISEISKKTGFKNHSSFSTAFQKIEKCTPEDLRIRMKSIT